MPELYFDSEEERTLRQELRDRFASQAGMDKERFDKCLEGILYGIDRHGFNKAKVKEFAAGPWNVPERFVDLLWEPIRSKAATHAQFSLTKGLGLAGMFLLFFLALLAQHLGIESLIFIKPDAPEWLRSKWFLVVAGVCLLAGIINVVRGFWAVRGVTKSR